MNSVYQKIKREKVISGILFAGTFFWVLFLAGQLNSFAYNVDFQWDPNTESDVAGYKLYYKTDSSELPFNGTGALEGSSPIDVQNVTNFNIHDLNPDKKYYIFVTVYDSAGNESLSSNIVEIPASVPFVISMPTVVNNMEMSSSMLLINGTVSNTGSIKSLTINGIAVTVAADGSFTCSLHLAKGTNTITTVVTDTMNRQTVDTKTVILLKSDAPSDFDGDGKTDYAVWRSQYGMWYFMNSLKGNSSAVQWGEQGDFAVPGDYDGDGVTDTAVWRPSSGTWYVIDSSLNLARTTQWGAQGDIPVSGDFDGDGKSDMAVWRSSTGNWYVIGSATGTPRVVQWGTQGDIPVSGDFDGDGKSDLALWRPSTGNWYILGSATGTPRVVQWGSQGDIPLTGYFDGDGKSDMAVWRPSTGTWYIIDSTTGTPRVVQWGTQGDIPVSGDFDGDGKTDLAVWRPAGGIWYITNSSAGIQSAVPFGLPTDQPLK